MDNKNILLTLGGLGLASTVFYIANKYGISENPNQKLTKDLLDKEVVCKLLDKCKQKTK